MDLFKFNYTTDPTVLERGEAINKYKSVMWTERYRDPGEFEIIAMLSSGMGGVLPIGTLLSHSDTLEVMFVENQEISEAEHEDPQIKITGRTLESYLENRIVGTNQARAGSTLVEYSLAAAYTWAQSVTLINDHIANATYTDDNLTNVVAQTTVTGTTGTNEARVINRGPVHSALVELLAVDDLGIKTIRRNTFTGMGGSSTQTLFSVYRGINKAASVIFSWKSGDLDGADYLWSDKKLKNSALVLGRYVNVVVDTGPTKFARRMMLVNGDDLDGNLSAPPSGAALTTILDKMRTRGRQALQSQNRITITRTDVSDITKYQYRRDYNIGDLVSLDGNFGQIATMRVVEYAEIEDENGESGHPTLSVPGEDGTGLLRLEIPPEEVQS